MGKKISSRATKKAIALKKLEQFSKAITNIQLFFKQLIKYFLIELIILTATMQLAIDDE